MVTIASPPERMRQYLVIPTQNKRRCLEVLSSTEQAAGVDMG